MNYKFTFLGIMAFAVTLAGCSKDDFSEQDAIAAQKELLDLKYQHELELETLKQKGSTALQELLNTAALQQLKLTDSLTQKNLQAERKKDYSVNVVDVVTNTPIADADVTVSSEGKVYSAKTNAQGIATFTSLYVFPTTPFLVSKTGYAATQILQQYLTSGPARLWNTSEANNEITGNLYIETDLTNTTPEKVGEKVLVTASVVIPNNSAGSYTVYFPTYTTATGSYSIKLPDAPNYYTLTFGQITAPQKLYVNATEDDAIRSFPSSLPRATTITTYFGVNRFSATVPSVNQSYYYKFAADKSGKTVYASGTSSNNNQIYLSAVGTAYQVERINFQNYYYYNEYVDLNSLTYEANAKVDVELIDVTGGSLIQASPKLMATANAAGKLIITSSPENGYGYVHLKRNAPANGQTVGDLVPNAKGVILKGLLYDNYSNTYILPNNSNLNTATYISTSQSILFNNKGEKRIINFYYGAGESREKQVY